MVTAVKGRPVKGDAKANHLQGAFGVTKSCRADSQLRGCWRVGTRAGSWASEEAARVVTQPLSECFSMRVLLHTKILGLWLEGDLFFMVFQLLS